MLKISQIFGPTIQGEGAAAGRHCLFVRTFNCNLECSWCDTAYTWAVTPEKAEKTRDKKLYSKVDPHLGEKIMSSDGAFSALMKLWDVTTKPTIIIVSGGEPMMQQAALRELLYRLHINGNEIHIETAGTLAPTFDFNMCVTQYNVSPKLESSGNRLSKRYKPDVLRALNATDKAWFKFVVTEPAVHEDFDEIDKIVEEVQIPSKRVMVMPEGSTPEGNIGTAKKIVDLAIERGFGLTFRSHVLLWGDDPDK